MRRQTVTIVDDDPLLRLLCAEAISDAHLTAIECSSGNEALDYLESRAKEVCLLITDVRMPGMSGVDLARTVAKRWPWIHIVVTSAYMGQERDRLPPRARFLTKPYPLRDLIAMAEVCAP
jgi:CheY-like chemotaxis protein